MRGVTITETVLALPLLLALIFAIIDLSRYFGVQGVASQGAQRGVDLAVKTMHLDGALNDPAFVRARTRVIEEAARLPGATLVKGWAEPGSGAHFVGFDNYPVKRSEDLGVSAETVTAVLLRPGDPCVQDRDLQWHCHPTVCPPADSGCLAMHPGARARNASDTMESLLQSDPIVIEMPVTFRALVPLPGLGAFSAAGLAAGYREVFSSGAYARPAEDPPPLPTETPTPYPPGHTPAPTATPQNTPPPTPTPIPCVPRCDSAQWLEYCAGLPQRYTCAYCDQGQCRCANDCQGMER